MGKIIKSIIVVLALCLVLTGCDRTRTVYTSEVVSIYRTGAEISVISHADGREYRYTLHRVRRAKNAAVTERKILETDTFTITAAGSMWIVTMPERKVYIRW